MRVAMARVLLGNPDVLLMDEPTNHLDIESIIWLEQFLKARSGALLMTSHDREFMNRVVSRIAEIDDGEITVYTGNYDFYERERAIRDANREAAYARQQAMLAKERRFIERFSAHAAKAAQVQSRVKALDKIAKIELPKKRRVVTFDFRQPARSGEQVVTLEQVAKAYGRHVVYDGLSMTIRRGERWCVMGRNGAGKTTLLRMVAGALAPDAGEIRLGASLKLGYFAQQALDLLDPELTVAGQLERDFPQESIGTLRNLAGAFQFSGDEVEKKIRSLSGGEKTRLAMARMLLDPPNFLVLDEPTNHLDLATKEMLVEALSGFEGTMLFVSHDRTFLRGLSNRVLELGGESGHDTHPHCTRGLGDSTSRAPGTKRPACTVRARRRGRGTPAAPPPNGRAPARRGCRAAASASRRRRLTADLELACGNGAGCPRRRRTARPTPTAPGGPRPHARDCRVAGRDRAGDADATRRFEVRAQRVIRHQTARNRAVRERESCRRQRPRPAGSRGMSARRSSRPSTSS